MQQVKEAITSLFQTHNNATILSIDKLPQEGSNRQYFRITAEGNTYIATHGTHVKENETFLYFTEQFNSCRLAVPEVLYVNETKDIYIQEDLGSTSLLQKLEADGFSEEVYNLYKNSLQQLGQLQVMGDKILDYSKCLTNTVFGKQAIMADLLYFKYYFLDALQKPYDKQKLMDDFEAVSNYLSHTDYQFFMFRDFQSRNIMVKESKEVFFIDYQGGMQGAPQYDVASLLWQAKAKLPDEWKASLLERYMDDFEKVIEQSLDRDVFRNQYHGYVLIRLLQVLGAYGFRGLFERKAHFLNSIPLALENLKGFMQQHSLGLSVPEFKKALNSCISDEVIASFTPVKATAETALTVRVSSFSFIKTGYPEDSTENGGGFVFDCRGILNPGRVTQYKTQSGLDKPVKDYLEQETKMPEFLNNVYNIIDISVEDYIKRGFQNLVINFGCTGGQHRSVYAAEAVTRHLRNKFGVKVELSHNNKENWLK